MHTIDRLLRFSAAVMAIGLCVLFVSCSSDDPAAPVDTCDEDALNGFSISNPERGRVYVWGGTGVPGAGSMGSAPGYTRLYWPIEVNFDPAGDPIVLDWNNHRVLALDDAGKFEKIIGGGFGQPVNGPALSALLNHPTHIAFSPAGTLFLSAWHNSIVMEMDMTTGMIQRYVGTGARGYNGDGQARLSTCADLPVCVVFHPISGELYFSDQANHVIRRIDASGVVHLVAGTVPLNTTCSLGGDVLGFGGDGGAATSALLHFEDGQSANPSGRFCFDADGNLYIADTGNHVIRIVTPDGNIATFAGLGPNDRGHSGDGGPATQATLYEPRDVVADADGNLFIADTNNHVIRKVAPDGIITTVVGVVRAAAPPETVNPISACALQAEHGAPSREVHLTSPHGIELDSQGNLWIADTLNNVVRIFYR